MSNIHCGWERLKSTILHLLLKRIFSFYINIIIYIYIYTDIDNILNYNNLKVIKE